MSNSAEATNWFQQNWGTNIFGSSHKMHYEDRSIWSLAGKTANATTSAYTGTITFYAAGFYDLKEVTATLMHELNNKAAGLLAPYYDFDALGGRGPKGSYTADLVGYRSYDAQCK